MPYGATASKPRRQSWDSQGRSALPPSTPGIGMRLSTLAVSCSQARKAQVTIAVIMTTLVLQGLIAPKFSAPSTAANETMEAQRSEDEVERYMRAQRMMSDAINKHLGFRGYGLMMRLQKAATLRDLHDLLRDVAAALVKRMGVEAATPIVSEIEHQIVPRQ